MALKFSTGVVNNIATGMGWSEIMNNSTIKVFSGTQPTSADNESASTLLCQFTTSGGTLTAPVRANCRVAFTGGTLAPADSIIMTVGGTAIGTVTGLTGAAATTAAAALANAINSTYTYPDYYAVTAGTAIGDITYGAIANAAAEVFVIAAKNSGTTCNALSANLTVSTPANAAYAINGASANTATTFANAAHGGGGTSANGTGVVAANALQMTYPANLGVISKSGTWSDANADAGGTAGWFRMLCTPNYDSGTTNLANTGAAAAQIMRIDGTVGTSGSDMIISSATIVANAAQTVNQFDFTVPSS